MALWEIKLFTRWSSQRLLIVEEKKFKWNNFLQLFGQSVWNKQKFRSVEMENV